MNSKPLQYRLNNDFQLAVLTLLAAIALLGLTPFTLLRAVQAQWFAFALDLTIQSGILACVVYAWRTGDTRRPSLALAYFIGVMAVVAVWILGASGRFWFYPVIVANFFLADRRNALAIALLGLTVMLINGSLDMQTSEVVSYAITVIVSTLLGYAFAYHTAAQREQLIALASKDSLTNLFNRRTLLDALQTVHREFPADGEPRGLLILDVDHFKQINDNYGHLTGDQVLVTLAQQLEQSVRKGDRLFRYGGEEFVVLAMPETDAGLGTMAENLRSAIEANIDDGHGHAVTASIGGALLRPDEAVQDWFARADTALYIAKNAGRNRVVIDGAP